MNHSEEQRNKAFAFAGMTGGVLFLVISLVIVLPLITCFGLCLAGIVASPDAP